MLPLDHVGSETYNQEEGALDVLREKGWDLFSTHWCLFLDLSVLLDCNKLN